MHRCVVHFLFVDDCSREVLSQRQYHTIALCDETRHHRRSLMTAGMHTTSQAQAYQRNCRYRVRLGAVLSLQVQQRRGYNTRSPHVFYCCALPSDQASGLEVRNKKLDGGVRVCHHTNARRKHRLARRGVEGGGRERRRIISNIDGLSFVSTWTPVDRNSLLSAENVVGSQELPLVGRPEGIRSLSLVAYKMVGTYSGSRRLCRLPFVPSFFGQGGGDIRTGATCPTTTTNTASLFRVRQHNTSRRISKERCALYICASMHMHMHVLQQHVAYVNQCVCTQMTGDPIFHDRPHVYISDRN